MNRKKIGGGLIVTAAGTGINLALGVLYTWSIFKSAIKDSIEAGTGFSWDIAALNDPYAVCCLVFAFMMIAAGRIQDLFGPRITALIGGVLVGAGFLWISQSTSYLSWVLGFGVLCGSGIAFGYSSATPAALKWYPPNRTGRISGIVVSGFGLASVYIAPLAAYLLGTWGIQGSMLFFGTAFFVVVSALAAFLKNPPEGYVPKGFIERRSDEGPNKEARKEFVQMDVSPGAILKSGTFWLLWVLYFIGAGAGLMVIGSVAGMAKTSMAENAFLSVAILAVGNAGGRIAAGILSDRLGRRQTLLAIFGFQAVLMFTAIPVVSSGYGGAFGLVLLATLIGFNYGANLALFPSFTKDFWGMKNFGMNYGLLFTAWGVGGMVMSRVSQSLLANADTFTTSFIVAGLLLVGGMFGSMLITDEKGGKRRFLKRKGPRIGVHPHGVAG